ncbi:MAG: thioredoxin-disulfide reductase [Candidatus Krumholzibacteriota bacterium]|nr:thioredoxin-disulfide reductase [Candidatus Krumholzibacteriota bacterium]
MPEDVRKVIILGSGPAGLTAAIYAARADLAPLVIEGTEPGGQLMITTDVENYPGFEDAVMGPDLMAIMKKQAARFGTEYASGTVSRSELDGDVKRLYAGEKTFESSTLIISTGASARWLGIEGEKRLQGRGVSACATCDGFFFRDQVIVVVGGGDTAMEEATFLTKFGSKVYVVHRRDKLRASKAMQERAFNNEKIEFVWDSAVEEVLGDEKVSGVRIKNLKNGEKTTLDCGGFFVAIGHTPNTDIFEGQLDMDKNGYLITHPSNTKTNIEGVFAAGDVTDHVYRQAVTAAGLGCMAALDAERLLGEKGIV